MGTYASNADVLARLPGRQLSAQSTPSTTTVDAWILQAEAELEAELVVQGMTVPVSAARGISVLKAKVTSYAVARWLQGVAAGTNLEDHNVATEVMKEFTDFIKLIREEISRAAAMLGQAPGDTGGATVVRSNVTDNDEGLTIANGDFDPSFTKGMKW